MFSNFVDSPPATVPGAFRDPDSSSVSGDLHKTEDLEEDHNADVGFNSPDMSRNASRVDKIQLHSSNGSGLPYHLDAGLEEWLRNFRTRDFISSTISDSGASEVQKGLPSQVRETLAEERYRHYDEGSDVDIQVQPLTPPLFSFTRSPPVRHQIDPDVPSHDDEGDDGDNTDSQTLVRQQLHFINVGLVIGIVAAVLVLALLVAFAVYKGRLLLIGGGTRRRSRDSAAITRGPCKTPTATNRSAPTDAADRKSFLKDSATGDKGKPKDVVEWYV